MGQKVQPTGFRLGVTESWRSRWYADKDYAEQLGNDLAIRKYLEKRLEKAAVARIDIERAGDKVLSLARKAQRLTASVQILNVLLRSARVRSTLMLLRLSVLSLTQTSLLSPSQSSLSSVSLSVALCVRLFSPLVRLALRVFVSSAPVV